jgi:hypothetical protein
MNEQLLNINLNIYIFLVEFISFIKLINNTH